MNIPPNQQPAGGIPMNMGQAINSQMTQGQQRITQQGQQQPQQPQHAQQQQQQQQPKTDEELHAIIPKLYAKLKSLVGTLRDTLTSLVTTAAPQALQQNSLLDVGSLKSTDPLDQRFNKTIEEFYSICDQIEYYLKTLIEIQSLSSSSERYMPLPVITPRNEKAIGQKPALSYSQFLMTVKNQVSYVKEVHDALMSVAQSLALGD